MLLYTLLLGESTIMNFVLEPLLFALPFYIANAVPIYVKKLPFLEIPIDNNIKISGKPIFGSHKTVRGFVFGLIAGTIVGYLTLGNLEHGFIVSFASLLGDLFGAFLKRRSQIEPGEKSIFHDRIFDVLFPVIAAYSFNFLDLSILQLVFLFIVSFYINNIANVIYYLLKVKDKPW